MPPLFSTRPVAFQVVAGLVVPAAIGALAGVLLGSTAVGYWALQGVAAVGGFLAGVEHRGGPDGADRGLIGGLLFGSFLLLAHAIDGSEAKASLGAHPGVLVVFTGVVGALIGALGGARRAAVERAR